MSLVKLNIMIDQFLLPVQRNRVNKIAILPGYASGGIKKLICNIYLVFLIN